MEDITKADLDIVVAGTYDAITMVEGGGKEVEENILLDACKIAHNQIKKIVEGINEIVKEVGKPKIKVEEEEDNKALSEVIKTNVENELKKALFIYDKLERQKAIEKVKKIYLPLIKEEYKKQQKIEKNENYISKKLETIKELDKEGLEDEEEEEDSSFEQMYYDYFDNITKNLMRESILKDGIRPDGRKNKEIRPISIRLNLFNDTHGSALFTRGETQALVVTTLGSISDAQILDNIEGELSKRFMLHYNFPPFFGR